MSYRPYGYSYPVPAPAAAVYASALTLEFLAKDLGYVYANGCWTYPNQSYGNELCTVSQQSQVMVPSLNCVGDNTTYDLQIAVSVLQSIAIVGLGANYSLPAAVLGSTAVPSAQAQLDYQAAKMYLGKSFSLMNSTSQNTVITDYRRINGLASNNFNILTVIDNTLATTTWPLIYWSPGTVVTFKTILLQDSILGFLFDGITTNPVCLLQTSLVASVSPSIFSGQLIVSPGVGTPLGVIMNACCQATPLIGNVVGGGLIPLFTGPVLPGSTTIVLPGTGGAGGYKFLGCNVPVGTPISWFTSASVGGGGALTPVPGLSFPAALGNLVAQFNVQVSRGVVVPAVGTAPFTRCSNVLDTIPTGATAVVGVPAVFTTTSVVAASLSSYTLQVNYS